MRALLQNEALRSAALYALALIFGKGVSLLMLPVVTRYLEPGEYGVLELLASIADVAGIVFGLGLADVLFRFGREPGMAPSLLGLSVAFGVTLGIVGQIAVPFIPADLVAGADIFDLRLLCLSLALTAAIQVPLAYLRYRDRPGLFASVSILKAGCQATLVAVFLISGFGVTGVLAGGVIADLVMSLILVVLQARDGGVRVERRHIRTALGYGLPLVASGMAGFCLGSMDRFFLVRSVSLEELAFYGLAAKFGLVTALAIQPFEMWWFPRRFQMLESEENRRRSADIVALGFAYAVFVAAGVTAFGPFVIRIMTPDSYHAAAEYVPWVALIALLHATSNLLNVGCYAGRTTVLPMMLNMIAAVAAVAGYAVLIPLYGVMGTITATIGAQCLRIALFFFFSQRRVRIPHRLLRSATLFGGTALAFVLLDTAKSIEFIVFLPVAAVGMALALGLVKSPRQSGQTS